MAIILTILALIIGISLSISGIKGMLKGNRSKSWSMIDGEIIKSKMKQSRESQKKYWEPKIKFKFTYQGKEYVCKAERFKNLNCGSPHDTENLLKKYSKGSVHKIYVSPLNPEESVLECGANEDDTMTIGFGILMIGFSIVGFIRYVL